VSSTFRGSSSTRGPSMTARGQSIVISIGMLPPTLIIRLDHLLQLGARIVFLLFTIFFLLERHGGDYGTKDIQVLHYGI
jgi:hypothetical protein